jgi:hypothetical protein
MTCVCISAAKMFEVDSLHTFVGRHLARVGCFSCMMNSAACLASTYGGPVFVPHIASSSSCIIHRQTMFLRDRDETSSQAMQICKVSARDMIGEENLKQKNNFLDIIKFSPAAQLQPSAWYIVRGKRWSKSERLYPGSQAEATAGHRRGVQRSYISHPSILLTGLRRRLHIVV